MLWTDIRLSSWYQRWSLLASSEPSYSWGLNCVLRSTRRGVLSSRKRRKTCEDFPWRRLVSMEGISYLPHLDAEICPMCCRCPCPRKLAPAEETSTYAEGFDIMNRCRCLTWVRYLTPLGYPGRLSLSVWQGILKHDNAATHQFSK